MSGPGAGGGRAARLVERVSRRIGQLVGLVSSIPLVKRALDIMDRYDRAGGGLLAAGLAFSSLFAILPAILLVIGLAGLLLSDPVRLEALANDLADRFPPLAVFFQQALAGMAAGAIGNSILGLVALAWGASRFYDSLDNAIHRIFAAGAPRNPVVRGIRGVLVIVLAIGLAMSVFVLVSLGASLAASLLPENDPLAGIFEFLSNSLVTNLVFFCLIAFLVYRFVPTVRPSSRAAAWPAVVVGALAALLTQLFTFLAPRLIGSLQVYGALVATFAAMIWLSFIAQGLLMGAAWVHARDQPIVPPEGAGS
jgi:membrane protein